MHADAAWMLLGGGGHAVFGEVTIRQTLHTVYIIIYTYIYIYIYIYTMEVSVWMQEYCLDAGDCCMFSPKPKMPCPCTPGCIDV